MISVEEIDPEKTVDVAEPVEDEEASSSAPPADAPPPLPRSEPDVEEVPEVLERVAKKRGRPKAAPKEKPMPKPKGRPRKVTIIEEDPEEVAHVVEPPPVTDDDLRETLGPILRIYAAQLMRGRQGKRARYRNLFSM